LLEIQYGRRDRAEDFCSAALDVIDKAADAGAEMLVLGGDTLNRPVMSAGLFSVLNRIHQRLKDRNIRLLVVTGNHDGGDPHWFQEYSKSNPENCHIIPLGKVSQVKTKNGFTICGIDHTGIEEMKQKLGNCAPADVLVIHAAVDIVSSGASSDSSMQAAAMPLERFSYVACGDIHIPAIETVQTPLGPTTVAMPGSTEITQSGEPLSKSFFLVTLQRDGNFRSTVKEVKTIPVTSSRPVIPIHIAAESDMESAIARLRAAADRDPIVYIRFNPDVSDVRGRINAVLAGSNAIIRAAGYDTDKRAPEPGRVIPTFNKAASLREAASVLMPTTARPYALAMDLLTNPADSARLIDAYIEKSTASAALLPPPPADAHS